MRNVDMVEKSSELSLLGKLSLGEEILKKSFLSFLWCKGYKSFISGPRLDKNGENFRVFRKQSYSYEENGERIYRNIACKDCLVDTIEGVETITDLFECAVSRYGTADFMGVRPVLSEEEYSLSFDKTVSRYQFGPYEWFTYSVGKTRVDNLSLLFLSHGFNVESKMALFLDTSPIWLLSALALFKIKSPVVTLFSTLSDENLIYTLKLTKAAGVLVDKKSVHRLSNLIDKIESLETVFCAACCQKNSCKFVRTDGKEIKVIYLADDDFNKPASKGEQTQLESVKLAPTDTAFIMFTSGSTGFPKGVILTHQNLVSAVAITRDDGQFWSNQVYIGYLPLSHIFEFLAELVIMSHGAKIGYGYPLSLFSTSPMIIPGTKGDLEDLQPTFFCTVPLLLERLKKGCIEKIKSSSRKKQLLFEIAYNMKLQHFKAGLITPFLDKLVFKKVSAVLGGRVKHSYIGGACLDEKTEEFMDIAFNGLYKQGYGLTESCCAGTLSNLDYWASGNTGPVVKCVELKLIPWEEGGYSPDNPENPCGHILISGKCISPGYYEMPELTGEIFVKDEQTGKVWFKTGDIGQLQPDGTFKIIDRLKDIVKLKHGEYVSLVHAEAGLTRCLLVDMAYVAPNATMDYMVALIIPNRDAVKGFCDRRDEKFHSILSEQLICDTTVQELIVGEIVKTYQEQKTLDKYETPRKIHILTDLWTPESGLLTPSAKFRRAQISTKYKEYLS